MAKLMIALIKKEKFNCMMHWTHFAAAIFKALFAYIGFLTFGNMTQEFITNNLPKRVFRITVNIFLILKADGGGKMCPMHHAIKFFFLNHVSF
jgi:hypothetical protein